MGRQDRPKNVPTDGTTAGQELRSTVRQCVKSLAILLIFSFFFNLLFLAVPIYTMQLYDRVISSGSVPTLVALTAIAAIATLFMGCLEIVRGMIVARANRWLERQLAPRLIAWSVRIRLSSSQGTPDLLRELSSIRTLLSGSVLGSLTDAPWAPLYLAAVWWIHPTLGAIGLASSLVLLTAAVLNEFGSRNALRRASRQSNRNAQSALHAIRNADVLQSLGMMPSYLATWTKRNDTALDDQLRAAYVTAVLFGLTKFARLLIQMIILGAGAYLVVADELTGGGMIAGSMLLARALAPIEQSIGSWRYIAGARDAYRRLLSTLDGLPLPRHGMNLPAPVGNLSCEKLMYGVKGRSDAIIKGLTFQLEAGEVLGIIGASGCGKSTLARLLVGILQPSFGHVRLDGAELLSWHPEQLGTHVGYLPQEVELFEGTVENNIARLDPRPDPEAVVAAALVCGIHEMILRLPNGYDTEIGEGGMRLSGGQRQRIGLARALYGRPSLIVLDEPNASLDSEGEACLLRAIETARGWGATVIVIAHLPHILRSANKLLLLRDGELEIFGAREEVFSKLRVMRRPAEQQQTAAVRPAHTSGGPAAPRRVETAQPEKADS